VFQVVGIVDVKHCAIVYRAGEDVICDESTAVEVKQLCDRIIALGMAISNIRQRVAERLSDVKNSSAEENLRAANPSCLSSPGSDSRTDSSSSTTDTSAAPASAPVRVDFLARLAMPTRMRQIGSCSP
jgi:hypothetical protein